MTYCILYNVGYSNTEQNKKKIIKEDFQNLDVLSFLLFLQDSDFYLYALYNKNKPKSDALMIEYGSQFFKVGHL